MLSSEFILESIYKPVPITTSFSTNASHFLLKKCAENVKNGRQNWLTNSITGESIKFSEIEPMSRSVAIALKKKGFKQGDVALYLTTDVTKIYTIILGIWRVGGCVYSSYTEDTKETLLDRIRESNAKWIFCDEVCVPNCIGVKEEVPWPIEIFVFGNAESCTPISTLFSQELKSIESDDWESDIVQTESDDPLILCTSGTTGKSKGAIYTNKNVIAFCIGLDAIPWNPKPCLYLLRCTHVLGLLFPLRNIAAGTWAVMMNQILKENICKAVENYKPFLAFGFPTYLTAIVEDPAAQKYDRSSLEIMCTGGLVITPNIYETLMKLPNMKAVANGFGMTECGAITTTVDLTHPEEFRMVPTMPDFSVGRLYPNTSLKIVDLDTAKNLGPNQKGEVAIKSPVMCSGYWNRPEENVKTFKDGWLYSGDIGYYDCEGFLFITGRKKDTFKYFNNHISPDELEEILLKHEAVAEACVFGISDEGGDVPRAGIVRKPNFNITAEEIQRYFNGKVASYKQLRGGVFILEALPRGTTGKVVRSLVAETILKNLKDEKTNAKK